MPSWSTNFEWLGYDSLNFMLLIGSIFYFTTCFLVHFILAIVVLCVKKVCCKCAVSYFTVERVAQSFFKFINATFYEILLAVSVSMAMLTYSEHYNGSDTVSVCLQFVYALILAGYVIISVTFSVTKVKLWQMKESAKVEENRQQYQRHVRKEVTQKHLIKGYEKSDIKLFLKKE